MKFCPKCKLTKPLDEFGTNKTKLDGKQGNCKMCRNAYLKAWYQDNKELHYARTRKANEVNKVKIRAYIQSVKINKPCVDCGVSYDPVCMDFDHIGTDKLFGIAQAPGRLIPLERVILEIAKCELVCANCHRLRTKMRRDALKTQ